jgi:demethylmenaquinone methyltransferase / 2-methoxy-6-polyprenyl-1,4-benzoquinol methylase
MTKIPPTNQIPFPYMYTKDSPSTIQSMFNQIAPRYDLTNSILSFSLHKYWNKKFVRNFLTKNATSPILVDVCAGTGDITFEFLQSISKPSQVYLIDFSSEMLEQAKKKEKLFNFSKNHTLTYMEADAQDIPLPNQLADFVSIAYGIRNVQCPLTCMQSAFRVLKPGGQLGILELTRPKNKILQTGHAFYLRILLPLIGKFLTRNKNAYEYLDNSIQKFIPSEQLEQLLHETGFIQVRTEPLLGGIATLFMAYKPQTV